MSDYRYRAGELLVHADDCDLIRSDLARAGYRPADRHGPLRRFIGAPARVAVPELLANLRARHGTGLRVSPHHVFTSDRIIWGAFRPRCTDQTLEDLPPVGGGEPVKVGVVDTGIVLRNGKPHPYIDGRVEFAPEDVDPVVPDDDGNPTGSDGHGTFVTGLILREAPNTRVIMKGVVDKSTGEIEDLAVAHAIRSLGEDGIKLINLSFSGSTWEDSPPVAIENALSGLPTDVVVVAASGNRGSSHLLYPAALKPVRQDHAEIVAVGAAVTANSITEVAYFSGYGPWVHAYADGVERVGPYFEHGYPTNRNEGEKTYNGWALWSGTSFAAATATGRIAALMAGNGGDAKAAWESILHGPDKITVWDVNGESDRPYIGAQ